MVTAGTSGAFLAVLYVFTDVLQHAGFLRLSKPFMCLGVNSITGVQLALTLQKLLHLHYRCSGVQDVPSPLIMYAAHLVRSLLWGTSYDNAVVDALHIISLFCQNLVA